MLKKGRRSAGTIVTLSLPELGRETLATRAALSTGLLQPAHLPGSAWQLGLRDHIRGTPWQRRDEQHPDLSCSWLELLVDFELQTGLRVPARPGPPEADMRLARADTLQEALRSFAAACRQMARDCFTRDVVGMFAPTRSTARLSCLGVRSSLACFASRPVLPPRRVEAIARAVITQRRATFSAKGVGMFQGNVMIAQAPLDLAGVCRWRGCTEQATASTVGCDGATLAGCPYACNMHSGTAVHRYRKRWPNGAHHACRPAWCA